MQLSKYLKCMHTFGVGNKMLGILIIVENGSLCACMCV